VDSGYHPAWFSKLRFLADKSENDNSTADKVYNDTLKGNRFGINKRTRCDFARGNGPAG
jgi:hypothetical protein